MSTSVKLLGYSLTMLGSAALAYIYWGYARLLHLAVYFRKGRRALPVREGPPPSVAVVLTVYNEEEAITQRLLNILASDYPPGKLRIVVVSDGSTDQTESRALAVTGGAIDVLHIEGRVGKTAAQNQALLGVEEPIVVFTDADTVFDEYTIRFLVEPFADVHVGCTTGSLRLNAGDAPLSEVQSRYWRYEGSVRSAATQLGILAVASGACMAVRRELIAPMDPTVGEDCLLPLMVVNDGHKVAHVEQARFWTAGPEDSPDEFRRRVRMTIRNWQGTWSFSELLNPLKRPGYSFSLWSHKVLRWLSPFFLALFAMGVGIVLFSCHRFLLGGAWTVLWALLPYFAVSAPDSVRSLPGVGALLAFVLANLGFAFGVIRAVSGNQKVSRYDPRPGTTHRSSKC